VLLTDLLKAVAAVLIVGAMLGGTDFSKYWAGLFCLLGHMFPCMFHFKGGKGILSGGAVAIMVDWRVALVVWGGFLLLVILTRYVSLGSLWAGASFPVVSWLVFQTVPILILSLLIGGLVVWQHRGNIKRLVTGTESKFRLHRKKS
jgi:glycerol-3-phosphate acyltransferase PlsY